MRPIPNLEHYFVSQDGKIFSNKSGQIKKLNPCCNGDGYLKFTASYGPKLIYLSVHRAVALTWLHNPKNKPQVNHINGIKEDNRLENLEWATQTDQNRHAINVLKKRVGENHANSKITVHEVHLIRKMHGTLKSISQLFGISTTQVKRIKDRETWKHVE